MSSSWTYKRAGVDLEEHHRMHSIAREAIARTAMEKSVEVYDAGYASWIRLGHKLALHIDGVGTKTMVLEKLGKLWVAGWDCVAMNVNDLAVAGFKPLILVDYIAMPRSDTSVFREIMKGIEMAARESGTVLVGGETAIMPGLLNGYDVVCTVLGVGLEDTGYNAKARPGDVVVGVESNGLHANGYSLARRVVEEALGGYDVEYRGLAIGEELSKPTHIYSNFVLEAIRRGLITAAAHITGGGFTKLKRILGDNTCIHIRAPEPPLIFKVIQELGSIALYEMYRVFNMGIGLVLTSKPENVDDLVKLARRYGFNAEAIGWVRESSSPRIVIETVAGEVVEYAA